MTFMRWYLRLRFLLIKNSLWTDAKTRATSMVLLLVLLGFLSGFTWVIKRFMIGDSLTDGNLIVLRFLLLFAIAWVFLSSFFQSLSTFVKHFLHSPELNHLMTLPIPSAQLFLFKFVDHLFVQIKGSMILVVPFFAAIGVGFGASWGYYLLLLPLYAVITIIPSACGLLVALLALRKLTPQQFGFIASALSLTINILFAFSFSRSNHIPTEWILGFHRWMSDSVAASILPVTSGIEVFTGLLHGDANALAWVSLPLVSALTVFGIYRLSEKAYASSWSQNQDVTSPQKATTTRKKKSRPPHASLAWTWVKGEWLMASRNHDMIMGTVFLLLFYVGTLLYMVIAKPFLDHPLLGGFLLLAVAAIFNVMATSIVFIPAEVAADKTIWKKQHWLLKTLPLPAPRIFFIRMTMLWIPSFFLTALGLVLYAAFHPMVFVDQLLLGLYSGIVLLGSAAVYVAIEQLALIEAMERHPFVANVMTLVVPIVYGVLSCGIVALSLGMDDLLGITWLSIDHAVWRFEWLLGISIAVSFGTVVISKKVFDFAWKKIEI